MLEMVTLVELNTRLDKNYSHEQHMCKYFMGLSST